MELARDTIAVIYSGYLSAERGGLEVEIPGKRNSAAGASSGYRFERCRFGRCGLAGDAAQALLFLDLFELQIGGSRDDTQKFVSWIAGQWQSMQALQMRMRSEGMFLIETCSASCACRRSCISACSCASRAR